MLQYFDVKRAHAAPDSKAVTASALDELEVLYRVNAAIIDLAVGSTSQSAEMRREAIMAAASVLDDIYERCSELADTDSLRDMDAYENLGAMAMDKADEGRSYLMSLD
jgi:23S rRNA U2552 (ribose-2'-O)-methylase RlmE/FtsJ